MANFTASNGITVFVRDGGTVQFQHGTREESCGILQVMPHSEWWDTLREYFQHEEDERLGRWRWPENPDYVVYPNDNGSATVFQESSPTAALTFWENLRHASVTSGAHMDAARAYFCAHSEPKPWHDAKPGEVWVLTVHDIELPFLRVEGERGEWASPDTAAWAPYWALNAYGISDGRRIWPEVTP